MVAVLFHLWSCRTFWKTLREIVSRPFRKKGNQPAGRREASKQENTIGALVNKTNYSLQNASA